MNRNPNWSDQFNSKESCLQIILKINLRWTIVMPSINNPINYTTFVLNRWGIMNTLLSLVGQNIISRGQPSRCYLTTRVQIQREGRRGVGGGDIPKRVGRGTVAYFGGSGVCNYLRSIYPSKRSQNGFI